MIRKPARNFGPSFISDFVRGQDFLSLRREMENLINTNQSYVTLNLALFSTLRSNKFMDPRSSNQIINYVLGSGHLKKLAI